MKSLGFVQDITVRLTFADDVELGAAEHALFVSAYHERSALQLAYNMCSTWQQDIAPWLDRHVVSIRHDPSSQTIIINLKSHAFAASEFVGLVVDVLSVLVMPPRSVGPLPKRFRLKQAEIFVDARQPAWFASLVRMPQEGELRAIIRPVEAPVPFRGVEVHDDK